MALDALTKRHARGVILKLVLQKHERQEHRFSDVTLLAALDRLSFSLYLDALRELLQDLKERDLLTFSEGKSRKTGEVTICEIQLRPRGRDVLEGNETDKAVDVE